MSDTEWSRDLVDGMETARVLAVFEEGDTTWRCLEHCERCCRHGVAKLAECSAEARNGLRSGLPGWPEFRLNTE